MLFEIVTCFLTTSLMSDRTVPISYVMFFFVCYSLRFSSLIRNCCALAVSHCLPVFIFYSSIMLSCVAQFFNTSSIPSTLIVASCCDFSMVTSHHFMSAHSQSLSGRMNSLKCPAVQTPTMGLVGVFKIPVAICSCARWPGSRNYICSFLIVCCALPSCSVSTCIYHSVSSV